MLSISAVPGSPKVTRCTSKPAAFRIFSSTPSAPASAGVTEGQRRRSRAIERASFMPPLNMRACRWASTVRDKFQFALLVPARPGIARGQRIGTEPVEPAGPLQAEHFDKTPERKNGHDKSKEGDRVGIVKPILELIIETGNDENGHHPPATFIAIVKPLDRGGRVDPQEHQCFDRVE